MHLIEKAKEFAIQAHESVGQTRKYTGAPYYTHVIAVAEIVGTVPSSTAEMVAAAYLHDTVEDTNVTLSEIEDNFGDKIASYVYFLTNVKDYGINRAGRKALDIDRLKLAPAEVKTIKLADIIHNCGSITEYDPGFAQRYLKEALALLEYALGEGDSGLKAYALYVIKSNMEKIGVI